MRKLATAEKSVAEGQNRRRANGGEETSCSNNRPAGKEAGFIPTFTLKPGAKVTMIRLNTVTTLVFSLAVLAGPVSAGPGAKGHGHDDTAFSAGEPGDTRKPAQTMLIVMREGDGKMLFIPNQVEVRKGEQVRFLLRNNGALDHEFVLATTDENVKHAEQMKKNPDMEHDDPNARRVEPKKSSEIVWRFTKGGQFEFGCLIPGHREAGMTGIVVVK